MVNFTHECRKNCFDILLLTLRLNKTRLNSILILIVYFSYQNNDISCSSCRHISIISDIIITIGISSIS